MVKEKGIFIDFLKAKGLKLTRQREEILASFLKIEKHLSVEDLYTIVKKKDFHIGHATVFRTLKLLCEAHIAQKVSLGEKQLRFEHKFEHRHHDHLYCTGCGKIIEFEERTIEEFQRKVCNKNKFQPINHTLRITGLCRECKSKSK